MNGIQRVALAALILGALLSRPVGAQQLIQNGGFESGSLNHWTVQDQAGSSGTFQAESGTTLDTSDPFGIRPTVGPKSGGYYAVTDENGSGSHALLQTFTVTGPVQSATLSFDMFVDNYAGTASTPSTLDYTIADPNQQSRVDLLTGNAGAFDVDMGVLKNFYDGSDPVTDPVLDNPHDYTHYTFDITNYVGSGGTYQLRFASANNQDTLTQGVDNVSVYVNAAAVPEASSGASFGICLLGLSLLVLCAQRKKAQALK